MWCSSSRVAREVVSYVAPVIAMRGSPALDGLGQLDGSAATGSEDASVVDPCLDRTWAEQGTEPAA